MKNATQPTKNESSIITPKILSGTRDFLPEEMAARSVVMQTIKDTFICYGYDEIETPAIEYAETLLGKYGEEGNKLVYNFKDAGGRRIALKFDQTVPFARIIAANWQQLPMPFKRYQVSKVWRAEKPQKGRLREFYQCDIDIIGTENLIAEAEIAKVTDCVFKKLGFPEYSINVNSRRCIDSLLNKLGIAENLTPAVLRALDKYEKVGKEEVSRDLFDAGLTNETVEKLFKIIVIKGTNEQKIKFLEKEGIDMSEMKEFFKRTESYGLDESTLIYNPLLARGLEYYTGVIYEVTVAEFPGSLCGGGRYDNLCSLFSKQKLSGVGISFGFERIMLAMEQLKILPETSLNSRVLVTVFDDESVGDSIDTVKMLTDANINAEIFFNPGKLPKQFKFADKKGIPFVVIIGPDEKKENSVTVKNLKNGKQKTIKNNQLVSYIQGLS